jgi:hypothetical protein
MLTEDEWRSWDGARPARLVAALRDGQSRPIFLIEILQ